MLNTFKSKLYHFINFKTTPPDLTADDGIRYWQERLIAVFVFAGTFLGFFVYVPSVALSVKEALWAVAVADTLLYGWIVILFFCRAIPFPVRAVTVSLVAYILGIVLLMTLGPFGGGPVWLFAFPVIMALLLGLRFSLIALTVNAATLIVIGILLKYGLMQWGYAATNPFQKWAVIVLNFLLLNSIVTISIALISGGIQDLLKRQKSMLTSLEKSEEKFKILFEAAPDAYYLNDLQGTFLDGNRAAETLTGYTRAELIGKNFLSLDLISSDQLPRAAEILKEDLEGKPTGPDEFIIKRKDGQPIAMEIMTVPTKILDERVILGIARDISERKRMEKSLQKAQKMESVGILAGGVAHDFNNLLQAIGGFTDMLLMARDEEDPDWRKLKTVRKAVDRAAQLVKQLLLFSRKAPVQPRPIDLNREIEQAVRMLERTIPRMIKIIPRLGQDLWAVNADPVQMEQMLLNLGSNASDAMREGGSLILETENIILDQTYTATHMGAAPGRYVLLKVSDTGCGMDGETLRHIFEPFFTSKEKGRGTGLGLASVYGIVKGHAGHITCNSELGRGTAFKIYLPAFDGEGNHDWNETEMESPEGGSETILVVDDEADIREMLTETLDRFGYHVIPCASGEEALVAYTSQEAPVALVILDLNMPGMGGKRCLQQLLSIDPKAKVLISSGYSRDRRGESVAGKGERGFIEKPFNISQILRKIRAILD